MILVISYAHEFPQGITRLGVAHFEDKGIISATQMDAHQFGAVSRAGFVGIWNSSCTLVNSFSAECACCKAIYYETAVADRKLQFLTLAASAPGGYGLRFIGNQFDKCLIV